jgi:hypothetical protein
MIVCSLLLLVGVWRTRLVAAPSSRLTRPAWATALTGYVLLMLVAVRGVASAASSDMAPFGSLPAERYLTLSRAPASHPKLSGTRALAIGALVGEIRARTRPEDRILVLGYAPQIYLFAGREMSGLLNLYSVHGLFVGEDWRRRTMERISTRPPALVVAPTALMNPQQWQAFASVHPEVARYVSSAFPERVYGRHGWSLWAAPGSGSHARGDERPRDLTLRPDPGTRAP